MGLKPFLRFVGSKQKLAENIIKLFPNSIKGCFYGFTIGGGSIELKVLESGLARSYYFADLNPLLVAAYASIGDKEKYSIFEGRLLLHKSNHSKDYYYKVRDTINISDTYSSQEPSKFAAKAADFVYLNAACFNGIVRFNSSGKFNVPFGDKEAVSFDLPNFHAIASAFLGTSTYLHAVDLFDMLQLETFSKDDFIYIDPPYMDSTKSALPPGAIGSDTFSSYNNKPFKTPEHLRLASILVGFGKSGVKWALSGADNGIYRSIYEGFYFHELSSQKCVSAKASGRGLTCELLVTNYKV